MMTDAEIIEKLATEVMGWKLLVPYYPRNGIWAWEDEDEREIYDWNPLEDMNDAWMVVERVEQFSTKIIRNHSHDACYVAFLVPLAADDPRSKEGYGSWIYKGRSAYVQRAICIAALKTKGIEVEE